MVDLFVRMLLPLTVFFSGIVSTKTSGPSLHPYYVSVTELEWNEKEKEVQVSCKLFTDDFEEALKQGGPAADLVKGSQASNKARIEAYLKKNLLLRINKKAVSFTLAGFENDQEATWCYLQADFTDKPAEIEITNHLLYEVKKEQVNIVHCKSGDQRKSFRLVNPDSQINWKISQ